MSGTKASHAHSHSTLQLTTTAQVSSDPESQDKPILEGAGIVTSDSLAAESLKSGGDFGSTTAAAAMSVPSHATTANTTDNTNATILPAAKDAAARRADEPFDADRELDAGRVPAPPPAAKLDGPKGRELTDGFEGNPPNASFGTEIGTRKDPGRVAVADIQRADARQAGDSGRPKDANLSRDGQFDVLKDAEA